MRKFISKNIFTISDMFRKNEFPKISKFLGLDSLRSFYDYFYIIFILFSVASILILIFLDLFF